MYEFYMKIKASFYCEYRSALLAAVFFLNFCMFIFIGDSTSCRLQRGRESQEEEGAGKKEGHIQETNSSTWKK